MIDGEGLQLQPQRIRATLVALAGNLCTDAALLGLDGECLTLGILSSAHQNRTRPRRSSRVRMSRSIQSSGFNAETSAAGTSRHSAM